MPNAEERILGGMMRDLQRWTDAEPFRTSVAERELMLERDGHTHDQYFVALSIIGDAIKAGATDVSSITASMPLGVRDWALERYLDSLYEHEARFNTGLGYRGKRIGVSVAAEGVRICRVRDGGYRPAESVLSELHENGKVAEIGDEFAGRIRHIETRPDLGGVIVIGNRVGYTALTDIVGIETGPRADLTVSTSTRS